MTAPKQREGGEKVYAVLIGSQLALWNARELSADEKTADFRRFVSKPTYINFTDANIMPVEAVKAVIQNSGAKKLENMLVVSTTLKNRYFLQFGSKEAFDKWSAAIRLSLYENKSLHQAYTGAFLSSRGARLSDIKVLLAHTKYDYGDWVSVRFGAGMPWKRCYAVISQQGPKKNSTGRIQFYENEKKAKKGHEIAVLTAANAIYAVYPSSPQLIDESTIIKVEGVMRFEKRGCISRHEHIYNAGETCLGPRIRHNHSVFNTRFERFSAIWKAKKVNCQQR